MTDQPVPPLDPSLMAGKEYNPTPVLVKGLTVDYRTRSVQWESPELPEDEHRLFAIEGFVSFTPDGYEEDARVFIPYVAWNSEAESFQAFLPIGWSTPWTLTLTNPND